MTSPMSNMLGLAGLSVQNPKAGLRAVLAMAVPLPARTAGLLLMAVGSTLLAHVGYLLLADPGSAVAGFVVERPLQAAAVQWLVLAASVFLIHRVGRAFGGRGSLPDALLTVVWLQLLMIGLQLVQLVALVIAPPLAALLGLMAIGLFFWLLTGFVAELHGFTSRIAVLAGIIATGFGLVVIIALLLALLLGPEGLRSV